MANDRELLTLYTLCDNKGCFVFQAVPGYYPGQTLSVEEFEYWTCYNIITQAKMSNVQFHSMQINDVIEGVEEAERKRQKKYERIKKGSN